MFRSTILLMLYFQSLADQFCVLKTCAAHCHLLTPAPVAALRHHAKEASSGADAVDGG